MVSPDEVVQFLEAVSNLKCPAALTCCYAAGLRSSEAGGLMVAGIESAGRHPGPARQGGKRPQRDAAAAAARHPPRVI
ncbi:MAG: hypothetical protein ACREDV_05920 [Methylocella sp.]